MPGPARPPSIDCGHPWDDAEDDGPAPSRNVRMGARTAPRQCAHALTRTHGQARREHQGEREHANAPAAASAGTFFRAGRGTAGRRREPSRACSTCSCADALPPRTRNCLQPRPLPRPSLARERAPWLARAGSSQPLALTVRVCARITLADRGWMGAAATGWARGAWRRSRSGSPQRRRSPPSN